MVALWSLAWAGDLPLPPSVSDADVPVLEWRPVVQAQVGVEAGPAEALGDDLSWLSARAGVEAHRRALTARVTLGGSYSFGLPDAARAADDEVELGEAWVNLDPYISEALVVHLTLGQQPVSFDDGRLVGAQDTWMNADFPLAARLHLGAAPWSVDGVVGMREVIEELAGAWWALRAGAGRARAQGAWQVDAVATGLSAFDESGAVTWGGSSTALGAYARADVARVRASADAYVQPFGEGLALMGGGRAGWAFGGDARVVLGAATEGATGDDDGTRRFLRPFGDYERAVGPAARLAGWNDPMVPGHVGVGAFADMVVTPGLRVDLAAWHYGDEAFQPLGPELDAAARLYFGPYAWLRLRAGAFFPYDAAEPVFSTAALSLDVQI